MVINDFNGIESQLNPACMDRKRVMTCITI